MDRPGAGDLGGRFVVSSREEEPRKETGGRELLGVEEIEADWISPFPLPLPLTCGPARARAHYMLASYVMWASSLPACLCFWASIHTARAHTNFRYGCVWLEVENFFNFEH